MNGKTYWRSLDELSGTPQFQQWIHREFPENASELLESASRRTLLKLMAASFGLAGLTACRRPVERILPASRGVEDYIPGHPVFYSTAMELGGSATGLLVETHDGRPTKIEGNPEHPFSRGAASAFAQASILGLYDPDRSRAVLRDGAKSTWDEFSAFAEKHFSGLRESGGRGLRILSQTVGSPSLESVRDQALRVFPAAKWTEYDPINRDQELAGSEIAFGRPLQAQYHFDKADVVLSLDLDFLGLDAATVVHTKEFSKRRRADSQGEAMSRLYVIENQYSITGAMADHRRRVRASDIGRLGREIAGELKLLAPGLKVLDGNPERKWAETVARDLESHRGRSLVVAGPRQPAAVHAIAHWINNALGNAGQTVTYTEPLGSGAQLDSLRQLAAEMANGKVGTLLILGGNPAYDAPADLSFEANLKKVPLVVHLGLDRNETAALSNWHIPEAHYLESWGDARALDGTVSIQQPMIEPLYGGKAAIEVIALIAGQKDRRAYEIVRNYWQAKWPAADAEKTWRRCLHDGIVLDTAFAPIVPTINKDRVAKEAAGVSQPFQGLEITFHPSWSTYDGRFANNGWLQEAPDPITKLTWDNAALVSPATAKAAGIENGDLITIRSEGREARFPVMVLPGHADNSVSVALGYGRRRCGRVGSNVGHNAYLLRTSRQPWLAQGELRKSGGKYKLATTQEHHSMEGRPLVREATLEQYRQEPNFAQKGSSHSPLFSLFQEHSYAEGNQWGMAIDLNSCVGCNACLLACQAENNIPIVGKDEVARGREMHWIRMDRYFTGGTDDPQIVYQPVACQQCENAPCESVCPVAATNHSPEGLNDMAYNRCIGTRYCANNCPYKVRRFNFLDWHKNVQEVEKMSFNPDVTVRMRGVMEKCTYCVQRIQETKIRAKADGRRAIRDGEIVTACQQSCPADAIVFGNINDPDSRVSKLRKQNRTYKMLDELNTKPRTTYLAKLRNPNPELV